MVKKFDEVRSDEYRALQVYLVLIGAAKNRQTLTYKLLAETSGFGGSGVFSNILGHIMYWCQREDLPSLTSLVVKENTGQPGDGLTAPENVNAEREKIYQFNWYSIVPPTTDELDAARNWGTAAMRKANN
jgi:hypothetical protein